MIRKFLLFSMALALIWTSVGCGGSSYGDPSPRTSATERATEAAVTTKIADGKYPVQQATYNDADGEYTLMLLNTGAGNSPTYRTTNLPMARLTEDEIKAGQKSYLKVESGQPSLYLTEDFKIEYVHNVTEARTNPQTGQQETVVVRQESNFWTPFLGAFAGQALASYLFRPQYYMPPVYQPGVSMRGWGGYGSSYTQAVNDYRTRYNTPPAEVRNRQTFRRTGQLRSPTYGTTRTSPAPAAGSNRSTGSGYGSSTLRRSPSSSPSRYKSQPSRGFGSSRSGGFSRRR